MPFVATLAYFLLGVRFTVFVTCTALSGDFFLLDGPLSAAQRAFMGNLAARTSRLSFHGNDMT